MGASFQLHRINCLVWRCYNTGGTDTYCSASSYEAYTQTQHTAAEKWLVTVSQKNACTLSSLKSYAVLQQHVKTSKLIFVLQIATKAVLFIARPHSAEQVTLLLHSKLRCCNECRLQLYSLLLICKILYILMLYCMILKLTGNEWLQTLQQQAVHHTWTTPECTVTSPRKLLNCKEYLSCNADFIDFTFWG